MCAERIKNVHISVEHTEFLRFHECNIYDSPVNTIFGNSYNDAGKNGHIQTCSLKH